MSWWGSHPVLSRVEARAVLPPGACRICVYVYRVEKWTNYGATCSRCGTDGLRRRGWWSSEDPLKSLPIAGTSGRKRAFW